MIQCVVLSFIVHYADYGGRAHKGVGMGVASSLFGEISRYIWMVSKHQLRILHVVQVLI